MTFETRQYSIIDQLLLTIDQSLKSLAPKPQFTIRSNPAAPIAEAPLTQTERRHAAGLMRVNHAGEICAQALYQGQALTARLPAIRTQMQTAAQEEIEHLVWCQQRIHELNSHVSYLNPFWYSGALTIGIVAGIAGDAWSLGFLAETEHQVTQHLANHLQRLPGQDLKSRAIVAQMQQDELQHAVAAEQAGATTLPKLIRSMMKVAAKCMTTLAYYL